MIVTLSGKGGVGKTSLTALLLDELARHEYPGRLLVVDGDPAMTLYLALGYPEPAITLANIRDTTPLNARTIRSLPAGISPADHVRQRLVKEGVIRRYSLRSMPFDLLAMGCGEGAGCYCAINGALSQTLESILASYSLIIVDNEAGLEHLSRYRIGQVDLFLAVATPTPAAWTVADRAIKTAQRVGMKLGETGVIVNKVVGEPAHFPARPLAAIPYSQALAELDLEGAPAISLPDNAPARLALRPIIGRLMATERFVQ